MTCKPSSSWGPPYGLCVDRVGQCPPDWLRMVEDEERAQCWRTTELLHSAINLYPPSPRLHSLTFKKENKLHETQTEAFHVAKRWLGGVAQQFCSSYRAQKTYLCTSEFSELGQKTGGETLHCLSQLLLELKDVTIPDKVVLLFSMMESRLVSTCRN